MNSFEKDFDKNLGILIQMVNATAIAYKCNVDSCSFDVNSIIQSKFAFLLLLNEIKV